MGNGVTSSVSTVDAGGTPDGEVPGEDENCEEILENHDPLLCGGVPFALGDFRSSFVGLFVKPGLVGWGMDLAAAGVEIEVGWGEGEAGAVLPLTLLGEVDSRG